MAVVDLRITSRAPVAEGRSFGGAGPFVELRGVATFAVDPGAEANSGIVDLELAPRDADGRVRFEADFAIVQPADPSKGSGRLLVEPPNRGRRLVTMFNRAPQGSADVSGDGFLLRRGWSLAAIGWQWDVPRGNGLFGIEAPPVRAEVGGIPGVETAGVAEPRGMTGQNSVEFRPNATERTRQLSDRSHKAYPAVPGEQADASLSVRDWEDGPDGVIPRSAWRFGREGEGGAVLESREHIYLDSGFEPGRIYTLVYEAEGAVVTGAGLLAFRDFASFLRAPSAANPSPAGFGRVYGFGASQTGRVLRHFLYLGLNQDEEGRQVYDGLHVHIAGGLRGQFNHRFAQPSVQSSPGFGQLFPHAAEELTDPFSEKRDGLFKRQRERGGMPKVLFTNTASEYWRGDGVLVHIDATGAADLEPAPEARVYLFAGAQHGGGSPARRNQASGDGGTGRFPLNVIDYAPLARAALVNLDGWVGDGVEPPPSLHPRLDDGTAVPRQAVFATFDAIPGLATPDRERLWRLRTVDLGPDAERGIGRYPVIEADDYATLVCAVDADGNELAGIRLPDLTVPVATNAGWNLRHPASGAPEQQVGMLGFSSFFPPTRAQRETTGDPRPSLEERYQGREHFLSLVRDEASNLAQQGYVMEEDIELLVANAAERWDTAIAAGATAAAAV